MLREKMKVSDRAKIFAPFDALKGFREMLKESEKIKEPRKALAEDYLEELDLEFKKLEVGKLIIVNVYNNIDECYQIKKGVLSKIDLYHKRIKICKEEISLKDVIEIEILENAF